MEYSHELRQAIRKYKKYKENYDKYKTVFFLNKLDKWRVNTLFLYRLEWLCFCKQKMEEQRANISAIL